jgi:hypothetical protein
MQYISGSSANIKTFAFAFVEAVNTALALNNKNIDYIHKHLITIYTYINQNKGGD